VIYLIRCVGCGREIKWDGKGVFAYTCPCGARVFYDEKVGFIFPASFFMSLLKGVEFPHIDYYLGKSAYWDDVKQQIYKFLRDKGAVWSWECDECKKKVIEQTKIEIKEGLYPFEIHPELKSLLEVERVEN
jgi:DNA-directed RNA polymerase subunit RPC12/RpoP/uncharacterized protein YlaI